jgi:phosphatidylglycerol:prolipoprotein diacylglycerol transferase
MFASPGPIAIQIGPLAIRWYGIFTAAAILVGLWWVDRQSRAEGLPVEEVSSSLGWSIAAGYVGARLYEVAFNWDYYGRNLAEIPKVWHGGLAIHGGLIVGCATGAILVARRRLPVRRIMDIAGPGFAIAQAIGRWGNFFNEEAFGEPTDLPWKLYISPAHRPLEYRNAEFFHPTFLYESLWDLAVFVALVWWLRPRWHARPGALFFWYIGLYSVGRFAIESVRLDSFWAGGYRVPQLASLAGIMVSVCGLVWVSRRARGRAARGGSR